ncbi:hypothetical protein SPRG_04049 [Saprolegnia parasitica CBS 223.65]|uniref:Uncharacterized protein n=1 Tax=Saprolegnia parasitica (strain CBS 223.65) TaxID=695850 RepID=A0A067CL43_SAPPC|nr:hypothetical protein SPRG_04049 [Saprolegnia parasitica CBS 223.65]KDO31434.1 hypothetical protein SPRG_04049 [Saprolegnia parasitica CBS 223.65]|eukprot:XP_012198029.1 hypothetical protein SPRG_04049 [Saprolegnia parasitica CBS 223.65]
MSDDDSDSEDILFGAKGAEYPCQKLRRVREIFLSRPQLEPQRRRSAIDLPLPPPRKDDVRRKSEPIAVSAKLVRPLNETTTSEDDSADDFMQLFGNQVEHEVDANAERRAKQLSEALGKVHRLCTPQGVCADVAIDAHKTQLESFAATLTHPSADHLAMALKELVRCQSIESKALRHSISEHQAIAKDALSRLESDFQHQLEQLRRTLAATIAAEQHQANERLAAMTNQLQDQVEQAARPLQLPKLPPRQVPIVRFSKSSIKQTVSKPGPSVRDLSHSLRTLPMLPKRVEAKLAACSPDMLARVRKLGQVPTPSKREPLPTLWPKAPLSPQRTYASTWEHGVCREDNNRPLQAPLSGRFLRPEEEKELRALKNSLGVATAWMARALDDETRMLEKGVS